MEYNVAFVCLLGMGTVFVGLICIVLLCNLIKLFRPKSEENTKAEKIVEAPVQTVDRKKKIAAVSAALAESLGTNVSAIRIKSFKKI